MNVFLMNVARYLDWNIYIVKSIGLLSISFLLLLLPAESAYSQQTTASECPVSIALGNVGNGIAARDNATGVGWIMWTEQDVYTRFSPSPHPGNADHLIAVQYVNGQWNVDNNGSLVKFEPAATDCLVAEVNFTSDTVSLLTGVSEHVNGIDTGYNSGDLSITANQWANVQNFGEFGVSGSYILHSDDDFTSTGTGGTTDPGSAECPAQMLIGNAGYGIAAADPASGIGWIMWSEESVFSRFSPSPLSGNTEHLLAVSYTDGQWFYDNNSGPNPLTIRSNDCLIAQVNFATDIVTPLIGVDEVINGIDAGYSSGDVVITPNVWAGVSNAGEFGVTGSVLAKESDSGSTDSGSTDSGSTDSGSTDSGSTDSGSTDSGSTDSGSTDSGGEVETASCPANISLGNLGYGIAAIDPAVGEGWIMWSEEDVHARFQPSPYPNNASNLLAVKYVGDSWYYDNNGGLTEFTPRTTDCLLAEVNFGTDTVSQLIGVSEVVYGIDSGYESGDLTIIANQWANVSNTGEFGLSGQSVQHSDDNGGSDGSDGSDGAQCSAQMLIGNVGYGIAAQDPAIGTGWVLWSEESVFTRFNPQPISGNADHLLTVTYSNGQWFYDNNGGYSQLDIQPNDCLIAEVNFTTDTVTPLLGINDVINGIDAGYLSGDVVITANIWAGVPNNGEFGVAGTVLNNAFDSGTGDSGTSDSGTSDSGTSDSGTSDSGTGDSGTGDSGTGDSGTTEPGGGSDVASCPVSIPLGNLGYGIAAIDPAVGEGWIMWSEEDVHARFQPAPYPNNASHLLAVKYVGDQWQYDNNGVLTQFTPQLTDCLVAEVNFSSDTVSLLMGVSEVVNGIDSGFTSGDLSITANEWANVPNTGEFGLSGSILGKAKLASAPVANAGINLTIELGNSVQLDGSASLDSDGSIVSWEWTLGDTQLIGTEESVTWLPDALGVYSIDLTVTDDDNQSDTASIEITIVEAPIRTIAGINQYDLVFSDEFDGAELDSTRWNTSLLWGPYLQTNNEDQMYIDTLGMHSSFEHTPFTFTGETLKITATEVSADLQPPVRPAQNSPLWKPNSYSEYAQNRTVGSPGDANYVAGYDADDVDYLSGILTTYGSFKMTHGYVEMRAKLPAGRGLWPAFWMLPIHWVEDVPEIDVMEFLGQDVDRLYNTYHYFDVANNWQLISTPSFVVGAADWTQQFHTFGMAWSPTDIIWYVNGIESHRITDADYDIANQPMHLIANLAVGGNWPGAADDTTEFPAVFEIDYIRAYKKDLGTTLDLANDYQLMFNDEFAGSTLDAEKWNTHFLWGPYFPINNEEQYYVDALGSDSGGETPFTLENGVLSITAKAATDETGFTIPESLPDDNASIWTSFPGFQKNQFYEAPSYTSGIITSYDSFKFTHGYAEIRAKVPHGAGLWPAFWLLNGYYVGQQPEIDIMEFRGENTSEVVHSYHHYDNGLQSQSYTTSHPDSTLGYADGFHTYGVRWQAGKISWYVDGVKVHTYESDDVAYQVMYVIANLAVGGDFNYSATDPDLFPASLDIDYIRVYQETGID